MIAKLRYYTDRQDPNTEYIIICTQEPEQDAIEDMTLINEITIEGELTCWPIDRFLVQE